MLKPISGRTKVQLSEDPEEQKKNGFEKTKIKNNKNTDNTYNGNLGTRRVSGSEHSRTLTWFNLSD